MNGKEILEEKVEVAVLVSDPETGDIVDAANCTAWGNPGYVVEICVNNKRVHKMHVEEEG